MDSVLFVVNEVLVIMYKMESDDLYIIAVTPLAGVWIEIGFGFINKLIIYVTPLAGVWIEITNFTIKSHTATSLPLRECGLK